MNLFCDQRRHDSVCSSVQSDHDLLCLLFSNHFFSIPARINDKSILDIYQAKQ